VTDAHTRCIAPCHEKELHETLKKVYGDLYDLYRCVESESIKLEFEYPIKGLTEKVVVEITFNKLPNQSWKQASATLSANSLASLLHGGLKAALNTVSSELQLVSS
jgi:hypothetical protein